MHSPLLFSFFFFNDTATTEIYTLSLHDALPISAQGPGRAEHLVLHRRRWQQHHAEHGPAADRPQAPRRSEEHTSELQSPDHLVCRLLLEKKKKQKTREKRDVQQQRPRQT